VPTTSRCSVCSAYHEINTTSLQSLESRLSTIEGTVKTNWEKALKPMDSALAAMGEFKRQNCGRLENNYCMDWWWNTRPSDALTSGEPYHKDKRWYIRPTNAYCALCSDYQKKAQST